MAEQMVATIVLDKKREGRAMGSAEIRDIITGFTHGEIPDYQMSALAMAICCKGMTERETADLTDAMMRSGAYLSWDDLPVPTADKHSTGGVGDKLSLVIQPLAAACGVAVPSLTGRGLGLTGGTADKLETIPGYSCSLAIDDFRRVVTNVGVSMAVQTDEICPADKKLYALRDVTGTVASIPLITASILSKKLAEGAGTLVFDVKCGKGAFMKTPDEAKALANSLVAGAKAAGRRAAALVTRMDAPLGRCIGNANEVAEAIEMLECRSEGAELRSASLEVSVELAALMVSLARGIGLDEARNECNEKLADGSALAKFRAMVEAHGGDLGRFAALRRKPTFKFAIQAMRSGYIGAIDAEKVARTALLLGAGREKAGDRIDPLAGVTLTVGVGDRITTGQQLATLERSADPDGLESCAAQLLAAFAITSERPDTESLIMERIN